MPEHNNVCCKFCKMVMRNLVIILIALIQTFHSPSRVFKLTSFQPPDQDNNRICQWPATRKCKRPVTRERKMKTWSCFHYKKQSFCNNSVMIYPEYFTRSATMTISALDTVSASSSLVLPMCWTSYYPVHQQHTTGKSWGWNTSVLPSKRRRTLREKTTRYDLPMMEYFAIMNNINYKTI